MRRLTVAPQAKRDLDDLLFHSEARFGLAAAERYRRLIDKALADLLRDPDRPSARLHTDLPETLRVYHLRHAALHTPGAPRVGRPRHLIVFSFDPQQLRIVRVLHDSMDAGRHVGDDEA